VDLEDRNMINIVLEEIRQGKIAFEGMELGNGKEEKEGRKSKKKD
jgi:hypothetical protein